MSVSSQRRTLLIVVVVLAIVAALTAVVFARDGQQSGPPVASIQRATLNDFNHAEHLGATTSECTYIPKKWKPGYSFTCYIYSASNAELGTVLVTSTSSATSKDFTFNESFQNLT